MDSSAPLFNNVLQGNWRQQVGRVDVDDGSQLLDLG